MTCETKFTGGVYLVQRSFSRSPCPPPPPLLPPIHHTRSSRPCLEKCYTLPMRVSKEVFKALCGSGIPFKASKSPPALSAIFPVIYLFAIYFFVIKKGWVWVGELGAVTCRHRPCCLMFASPLCVPGVPAVFPVRRG